ncbi:cyclic pyranopterin monophosphate synthase MoaC [Myxococcota bacterium]|nr:cyclic pyranopterin monophosphate synthase MoaC [Myxococcota bacterium]MBU1533864.1 cyclic pyranopterin monophosphate synthase MoaC [Myxococcota bacterium]
MNEKPTGMIDVGSKESTKRIGRAMCRIQLSEAIMEKIVFGTLPKGDVLQFARVAGIMAAKSTPALIPLCHPLNIERVAVDFVLEPTSVLIKTESRTTGKTGVEMEALVAAQVAALTIYDMCKMFSREMVITDCRLVEKSGGKSGHYMWTGGE